MKGSLFPFESLSGLDETLPAGEGYKDNKRGLNYILRRGRLRKRDFFKLLSSARVN